MESVFMSLSVSPVQNNRITNSYSAAKNKDDVSVQKTAVTDLNKADCSNVNFRESIVRRYNRTGIIAGYYAYEGSVNDKAVNLKPDNKKSSFFINRIALNGTVDSKPADIIVEGKNVKGTIGDTQFNLEVGNKFFDKTITKGNIDGKAISVQKGEPVSNYKDESDVLTLAASLCNCAYNVKDGRFGSLGPSLQAERDLYQQMMMYQATPLPMYYYMR